MTTLNLQIKIKHSYLITNTVYKMLHQTSFLEIMHRYDIRRNVKKKKKKKKNTNLCNIKISKDPFWKSVT